MEKKLREKRERLFAEMKKLEGARQWDTAVGMIQRWYYGCYVKAAWCATTVSYAGAAIGLPKHENVYSLMMKCKERADRGDGKFFKYHGEELTRGDVLFWLWSGTRMTIGSSKHVGVCASDTPADASTIPCIGGNQSNSICTKNYEAHKLYAVYRPI